MVKYKNVTIKLKGGGTRKQRARVLASGKLKFVKNLTSKVRSKVSKTKSTKKRKTMGKKKRRGKRGFTIPLAPTLAIAGQFTRAGESGWSILDHLMAGNFDGAMKDAAGIFVGIKHDGSWDPAMLIATYGPIMAGMLIHKFVGGAPLNINRMLASAGVPIIRI